MLWRGGSGGMATATGPMGARTTSDGSLTGRGLLDMGLGGGDLLAGSAFSLTRETRQGGLLSFWSRGAQSQFAGRDGALSLGGGTPRAAPAWTSGAGWCWRTRRPGWPSTCGCGCWCCTRPRGSASETWRRRRRDPA